MATNAPTVSDLTLQKFIDAIIACVRYQEGSVPDAAPNAFKDRLRQNAPVTETGAFTIIITSTPVGDKASVVVEPLGSKALAIVGQLDLTLLASKLA